MYQAYVHETYLHGPYLYLIYPNQTYLHRSQNHQTLKYQAYLCQTQKRGYRILQCHGQNLGLMPMGMVIHPWAWGSMGKYIPLEKEFPC